MVLELAAASTAAAPTVTRIRQKLPLLAGHGHAVNQVLVIRDCALHQVLTAEQLQALAGGFRTAYHAALRRENKHLDPKHLMQQVARLDGTPAALPTGAAAATKDKKSGVSFGECCINLGYRIPQNKKVAAPGLYAKHAHEEWRLFCDTVAKGVVSDCWTFIAAQRPFSRLCETMLKLNQNAQFAPGTGFSSMSCTSDLARGVHTDWGNLLITAILAVIDKEAMKRATGAAHVMFGRGGSPAVLVLDSPHGVLFVGPYDALLHSNLATYIGTGETDFPWYRHSTSFYLKRRVVEHNLANGVYDTDELQLLAKCVLAHN